MQPLCPKPRGNHYTSPSVGCRERGRDFLDCCPRRDFSKGAYPLVSAASLLPHPSAPPLTAKPDIAFLWRAEREGEVPVGEQPSGC